MASLCTATILFVCKYDLFQLNREIYIKMTNVLKFLPPAFFIKNLK